MIFFFFSSRRRHTRYIGDWSSDVCSSDLRAGCRRQVEKDLAMSGPIRPWIVEVCERGLRCREASQKPVPIDGALLDGLRDWSTQAPYRQPGDWVFASPVMDGKQPYWQKQC